MQRIIPVLCLTAIMTGSVSAQRPLFQFADNPFGTQVNAPQGTAPESTGKLSSSPSDKYRSFQQAMDAKGLVQRNATIRASQRRHRLATRKWFGYSNLRPITAAGPYMTHYARTWTSHPRTRYHWFGRY